MKNNTLRDEICKITKSHLKKYNSLVFGQNLLGVGQVNGTLPKNLTEKEGIIDLPMADVAGGGIVTGAALSQKRPFYIIRYQGYNWFNMIFIINYASKSYEIWKTPCPIFVRGIANEGNIGPVAGSAHLSLFYKMPGIKIFSPMTPFEYRSVYKSFIRDNCVYYISEHRKSYDNIQKSKSFYYKNSDVTVLLNSVTRQSAKKINEFFKSSKYKISILHIFKLKPFKLSAREIEVIKNTKKKIIICDNDYEDGLPAILKSKIMNYNKIANIDILGLPYKSAGHHSRVDVLPPDHKKIINQILLALE